MSIRSMSSILDKDNVAKAFIRSFIELVENFVDEDAQLDTVYRCITALFESMSLDDSSAVLKKILMHFMRKFPNEIDEDVEKSDEYIRKTLKLWQIFGKCSKTMGLVAILERVEDTYVGCWQYYQIYAETLIDEGQMDTDKLYKVFKNCMEHCDLSDEEVRKIFGPKIMAHVKFPEPAKDDESTIQFMQVRQNNLRKSLAAKRRSSLAPNKLHAIFEDHEENPPKPIASSVPVKFTTASTVSTRSTITPSNPSAKPTFSNEENLPVHSCSPPRPKAPPVRQHDESLDHDVQDTIQLHMANAKAQQPQQHYETTTDQTSTTMMRKPPPDDFSVFKDPSIVLGQRKSFNANANSPTVCGAHLLPKKNAHLADPLLTSTPENFRKPLQPKFNH